MAGEGCSFARGRSGGGGASWRDKKVPRADTCKHQQPSFFNIRDSQTTLLLEQAQQ